MTKLIEKQENWEWLRWGEGFFIGVMVILFISLMIPHAKPHVIQVPVTKVVEKPVVIKVPVKLDSHDQRQIQCLAKNAYFEAGNQTEKGMIAVTNVVMNRVSDNRFPKTPCAVVNQKRHGVCQFSWVCEGKSIIRNSNIYDKSRRIAEKVYLNNVGDVTNGAKFYHADYVRPSWSYAFNRTRKIGDHIFYRG